MVKINFLKPLTNRAFEPYISANGLRKIIQRIKFQPFTEQG